ncbi:L-rhamnose mutarotase [Dyadobacter arcticus]|uniref:L-rhamnose mutarotase n=1 Tax=Dyadobacter arcticus TaxID=1078754 RepID=A0ABX0UPE2_9BACT|nr:L-rhamnose mutarotase [Dyadobacter arcticus]NIJ54856.1 L-rhamnose mutarotase [Dyadobacter arcticus]
MKKYCLAVDLVNDPQMIEEYEEYHKQIWPEIEKSIKDAGISQMEIYRLGERLFMIMETEEDFSFENKAQMDASNAKVQEWEELMWKYQKALPSAKPGEKWVLMNKIFALKE